MAASVLMTVPLGLTAVVRVVRRSIARPASIAGAAFMTLVQLGSLGVGTAPTASYLYFSVLEVATTAFLAWYSVRRWAPED
jgi:threonine/homoserine/homoserine lactone efflux protein